MSRSYHQVSNQDRQHLWNSFKSLNDYLDGTTLGIKENTARKIIASGRVEKRKQVVGHETSKLMMK